MLRYRERLAEKEDQANRDEALSRVPSLVYMYKYIHMHTRIDICVYYRSIYLTT